jgi:hypothetical protein
MPLLHRREVRVLAVEAIVMVCSILIALWVDSWREARIERRAAAEAAEAIDREVADNLRELVSMRDDIAKRMQRLAALGDSLQPGRPFVSGMGSWGGFRTTDLSRSAWERASLAAIANRLDPAYLRQALAVYQSEDWLRELDSRVNGLAFGETFFLPERTRVAWLQSVAVMRQQASWLSEAIPLHEEFLRTYAPDLSGRAR